MGDRAKAEKFIHQLLKDIDKSGFNNKKYEEIFSNMSDKDFDDYMTKLEKGEATLVIFSEPFDSGGISIENNMKVAEKYGIKFYHRLTLTDTPELGDYKTPIEYLVLDLPVRRQSQNLIKKISYAEHNKVIDNLTYQPTNDSKSARLSYPELQVLISMGLENSLLELFKFRGGDKNGFNAYNHMVMKYGSTNLKTLVNYSSGVVSTKTLKAYLLSMHIKPTL